MMICRHRWIALDKYEGNIKATVMTCADCGRVLVQTFRGGGDQPEWKARRAALAEKLKRTL